MIYYFSGTGNSRVVTLKLSAALLEEVRFIPDSDPVNESLSGESVGFVFPVYSWGVPPLVIEFIRRLPAQFWMDLRNGNIPLWVVMTCGDEVAMAPEMLKRELSRNGVEPESIWSVIMPNNYVLLPGFDVDSAEVERKKLQEMPARIKEIASGIRQHRKVEDVERGSLPWLKTELVYPIFKKWGIFPRKWHVSAGCVGCGICAGSCPLKNVSMADGNPVWGDNCCSCLACYHSCPRHAVEYGGITARKGQYFLSDGMAKKL